MSIGEKLRKALDDKGITAYRIAKDLGFSPSTITNYINNSTTPDAGKLQMICQYIGIPIEELLGDKLTQYAGKLPTIKSILEEGKQIREMKEARPVTELQYMDVPFVPIHAQAGYPTGYGDLEYIDSLPTIPVVVDKTYKGKYRVFEAKGDSMDDDTRRAIWDRDRLLCREISRVHWKYKLHILDWVIGS